MVLLGNSAHTIHNNAAQGFNLGLRDAAGLAEIVRTAVIKDDDPGTREVLDSYLALRRDDQARVIRFTDMLATSFYNNHPGKIFIRDIGMMLTDLVLPVKYSVMKQNMGLWQRQPLVVRQ